MVAVVTVEQMRRAEAHTMRTEPIASVDLMERAGARCASWISIAAKAGTCRPGSGGGYLVLAGPGNNGGDGLVIARHLHASGFKVHVLLPPLGDRTSPERDLQLKRAREAGVVVVTLEDGELPEMGPADVIIDALYGIGLRGPLEGWITSLITSINAIGVQVVAVDIPSGLQADGPSDGPCLRATWTLTFEWAKTALVVPEHADAVGELVVLSVGIRPDPGLEKFGTLQLMDGSDLRALLHPRPSAGHKGTFGHAVLVAGSAGKLGAALLATRACARSGVGTVTVHLPGVGPALLHATIPEAMCSSDGCSTHVTQVPKDLVGSAWGVGPGLGSHADTALMLKRLIQDPPAPLVLDADALNILAANPTWSAFLPAGTILTPHPKELDRILGSTSIDTNDRWTKARELAVRIGCVVVVKGATTAICTPAGHVLLQRWNNSGLAKGGSGDALTGLITGLRAQGYESVASACLGVYLHGTAAHAVAQQRGYDGMLISDVIEALPEAWKLVREGSE